MQLLPLVPRWPVSSLIRHLVVVAAGLVLGLATVGVAFSYWSVGGSGAGAASTGGMAAPTDVTAQAPAGSADVSVAWSAVPAPDGGPVDGYHVQRWTGGTPSPACGSAPGSLLAGTSESCTDVAVPNGDVRYTVTAAAGSWSESSDPSPLVTVDALRFLVQAPASTVAGAPLTVTVTAQDGAGTPLPDYQGTIRFTSSDPGSPVLPADYTFTTGDGGTKTFVGGVELRTTPSQGVTVTDVASASGTGSTTVAVTPGSADRVVFTRQPGGGTSNAAWTQQPQAAIQDMYANTVTGSSATISLAVATGTPGAVLTCTATAKPASAGVASFAGCAIDKSGSYTLSASSPGMATGTSDSLTIGTGPATKLVITRQPTSTVAGQVISPTVTVAVQDAASNVVTTSAATVTMAIGTNPAGGALSGTTSTGVVDGVATFADLSINRSAATGYTLSATSAGLTSATSAAFVVSAGTPTKLAFTTQPGGGTGGVNWATQPRVTMQDALGNTVLNSPASVAVAITSGTGASGAVLTCAPRTTVSGVAAFASCRIDKAAIGYTLTATSSGLTAATSATFTVAVGPATRLAYSVAPSPVVAGSTIAPGVTVAVQDAGGNTVTTSAATVNLAIGTNPASGTLSGAAPTATSNGVATFSSLSINRSAATGYTLVASATGLPSVTSAAFVVSAGTPTKLAFTTQSGGGTGGVSWATQPRVAMQDALGNTVLNSPASVAVAITSGTGASGAVLTCAPQTTASGVAAFTGCRIDKAGTGYTLTATSGSLTAGVSAPFDVVVGPATRFVYSTQPSAVTAGAIISPAVSVTIQDAGGNVVTSSSATVTVAIGTNPAGGTLSGVRTATASAGVATFSDLSINRSSTTGYTLIASSPGVTNLTSAAFVVSAGTPTKLAFTTQPGGGTGGVSWATQPRVAMQDALGNTVLNSPASVAVAITSGTGASGAVLTCAPQTTASGVAAFTGCRIDKAGTGYTLTATSGSLTAGVSAPFDVVVGPATRFVYSTQPSAVTAGAIISPAVSVTIQDAGGNVVTSSSATVTVAIGTNPAGGTLSGVRTATASAGVATFSNLSINRSSTTGYTLIASSPGVTSLTSAAFVVSPGAASRIAFTTQPGGGTANVAWTTQPRVSVQDALGNTVPTSVAPVQLSVTSGTGTPGATLTCTANPRNAASGLATFAGCRLDRVGTGYTLTATSGSWTAVSAAFTIS